MQRGIVRNCLVCGKKLSKHKPYQRYYCGHTCLGVAQRRTKPPETRTCIICGKLLNWWADKYCSQRCNGDARKKEVVFGNCKQCGSQIQRIKNGEVIEFCNHSCAGKYIAEQNKVQWKAGMPERIKSSIAGTEASPLTGRHETNKAAKMFSLLSPNGRVYTGKNLRLFVRNSPHLFEPDDVVWKPYKEKHAADWCRAANGLASLSPNKKHPLNVWKGWTWYGTKTPEELVGK